MGGVRALVRPISWIVVGVSVTGLVVGARAVSARRRAPVAEPIAAELAPAPAPRPPAFQPAPPVPRARPTTALAHLRGRVLLPPGTDEDLDDLVVTASDGERHYEADTTEDGRFELHLPARAYTVTATLGTLVGAVVRRLRPGGNEELEIRLQPGAAIEVTVDPPGLEVQAAVRRAGGTESVATAQLDDDHHRIEGLLPGAVYDLTVRDGLRKTILLDITAPARVRVELPPLVTLRGGIGFAAGTRCPFRTISAADDHDNDYQVRVDRNCRFQLEGLAPDIELHLSASEEGWHVDEQVRIPAHGEPEPVCLNPPCRDLPPVAAAELEVILTGAPAQGGLTVSLNQRETYSGCGGSGDRCEVTGIEAEDGELSIGSKHCEPIKQPVSLHAGRNTVSVLCRRMRLVEGIVRGRDLRNPGIVSCQGGGRVVLTENSVFELRCPAEAREIDYQTHRDHRGVEASASLTPGADPVFVELTL